MALVGIQNLTFSYCSTLLFKGINLQLNKGERVALIGRNGVGKSTLLKVIAGYLKPDSGIITIQKNSNISYLDQEISATTIGGRVYDIIRSGLVSNTREFQQNSNTEGPTVSNKSQNYFESAGNVVQELDKNEEWIYGSKVSRIFKSMDLDADKDFGELSGGQKKKVMLAKAIVNEPDTLLLDEPTNHLDINSICLLEEYLLNYKGCLLFVTHDRSFMQKLSNRIVELDRGMLFSSWCDYNTFLKRKQTELDAEEKQLALFEKKLNQEEIWIRKGIRARRIRNEGRVRALIKMRNEKKQQKLHTGNVKFSIQDSEKSGRLVIKANGIAQSYKGEYLFRDFSTLIMRGDKIGIIGANGSGKTTLLRILLGIQAPQEGEVNLGTSLEIAYFDQLRAELDEEKTIIENISGGNEFITINNQTRHINGYLKDFLFTPERCMDKISILSGGERNRVLLAKLFTRTSNLIVMDEPTNDLDLETLELLEELLHEYKGTLLLVSHDRTFLNNIVTSTIALEGGGIISEYPGGYDDWLEQRNIPEHATDVLKKKNELKITKTKSKKGLSFKEQKELDEIIKLIQKLEEEHRVTINFLSDPSLYENNPDIIKNKNTRLESLNNQINAAYERWDYLEKLKESFKID